MTTQIILPAILALQSFDDGLTSNEVIQSLPRDPASIFALLLRLRPRRAVVRPAARGRDQDARLTRG